MRNLYTAESAIADLSVLCLGLGRPYGDRTAKIQLAFILELTTALGAPLASIRAFDPVFEDADARVLRSLGCEIIEENLRGQHALAPDAPHLLYMPHCSKALYESVLSTNFGPRLGATPPVVLLGNDLGDYLPGFVRATPEDEAAPEDGFVKPKKKRKGRGAAAPPPQDSVLRRLVPHFEVLMLSELPETNLPGFARAFLSSGFQWLTPTGAGNVDWETPLPPFEWPEDGEVL